LRAVAKKVSDFFKEVWRRNVFQIAIPYGVVSWVLIQIADTVLPAFDIPNWVFRAIIIVLAAGFPVAIIVAWVFDITPGGLVKTDEQDSLPGELEEDVEAEEPAPALSLSLGRSERRRVTMLKCLFSPESVDDDEIDPEDMTLMLTGIEAVSQDIVAQFDGFRLPSHPEELSIIFGYPNANEDDARRAVAAGLALLDRIREVSFPGLDIEEVTLTAHAAVYTGLVVLDDKAQETDGASIVGAVARTADHLLDIAPVGNLVIGEATFALVSNHFRTTDLGLHKLGKQATKLNVHRIDGALKPGEETSETSGLSTQIIGRDHELQLLTDRWENVVEGDGQFVLLRGEAGIGKSALIRTFLNIVKQGDAAWLMTWFCSPYEKSSAFHPLIQFLRDFWFKFEEQDSNELKLQKIEERLTQQSMDLESAVPLMANLLSVRLADNDGYAMSEATSQVVRNRTMDLAINMIHAAAKDKPVLLLIDGLHWADPSTAEMLERMLDSGTVPGVFILMSARLDFRPDWRNRSNIMEFDLHRLARRASREMVISLASDTDLPDVLINRIVDETDGVPMFIEALTLAVLQSDVWRGHENLSGRELEKIRIPATLHESLAARIDKMDSAKTVLQLCSMLGRQFSYHLLLAVSASDNESALQSELSRLVEAELLFKRKTDTETAFTFKHFLVQETAYQSLLKSTRKSLHVQIGEILEGQFPEIARQRPQQLAHHFASGGHVDKAISYWTNASRRSFSRSANLEAIEQARAGLKLVSKLPESRQRDAQELPLQSVLGSALLASQGYTAPEVKTVFTRADALCKQVENTEHLFPVVVGLWMFYTIRGQYEDALETGAQLIAIAEDSGDVGQIVQAHYTNGSTRFYTGDFNEAKLSFEKAIAAEVEGSDYSSQSASADDTRTHVRCLLSHTCWHLGLPETASQYAQQASDLVQEASQSYATTFISFFNGWFHQLRKEPDRTAEYADECVRLAEENGYRFFIPLGRMLQAWVQGQLQKSASDDQETAVAEKMQSSLEICQAAGVGGGITYLMFSLAEELLASGKAEEALEELTKAWQHAQKVGEYFLEPEYFRMMAALSLHRFISSKDQADMDEASSFLTEAMSRARHRGNKALELRAATDFALLLSDQGESERAIEVLDPVVRSFQEFDQSGDCMRAAKIIKTLK